MTATATHLREALSLLEACFEWRQDDEGWTRVIVGGKEGLLQIAVNITAAHSRVEAALALLDGPA